MTPLALATGKDLLVRACRICGVFRLFRWLNRNRLLILTYHSVLPSTSRIEDYEARNAVDEAAFRWQMRYLAKHYRCLPLGVAVARLARNETLPPYSAVVTFDDGFRNNLRYAIPILRECGVPATIFLTTGHIGRGAQLLWTERVGRLIRRADVPQTIALPGDPEPVTLSLQTARDREPARRLVLKRLKAMSAHQRAEVISGLARLLRQAPVRVADIEPDRDRYTFLSWSEARELARSGVTLGSHTVGHEILTSLEDERRVGEVHDSKQAIERHLGVPCTLFSYPNGTPDDFDDRDKSNLRRAGYLAAVTQIAGLNDSQTDRYALKRVNIGRGHTAPLFVAQLSGFWPWIRLRASKWSTVPVAGVAS